MPRFKFLTPTLIQILALYLLLVNPAFSLPDDRKQSIQLQADKWSFDQKNGVTTYTGNAQLQQGSLIIKAQEIIVYYTKNKNVERIEAIGSPARLQQQPSVDQNLITASANKILYLRNENIVEFLNNAELTQAGAIMRGKKIHYDLTEELVHAEGGDTGIKMTIPASTLKE